jgi:hypothetical protein
MKFKRTDVKKEVELISPLHFHFESFFQIRILSILRLFVCFIYFEINDFELKNFGFSHFINLEILVQ